jgi:hypothetical protein
MRADATLMAIAFAAAATMAQAQNADDPVARLRACSGMTGADRIECLDRLAQELAMPTEAPAEGGWTVSETTSPVDYAPLVTATVSSREIAGVAPMRLIARCRSGRTELALAGAKLSGKGADYALTYRINGGRPTPAAATLAASGTELAFAGDVVQLLQMLPASGEIAVTLSARAGPPQRAFFVLDGLKNASQKLAAACKWPRLFAEPHGQ